MMKTSAWLFAAATSISSIALAQTEPQSAVRETTDPARIADIERRAQELASRQETTPMMGEHEDRKHHGVRHHEDKKKHRRAMKDKRRADPAATENR